MHANAPLAERDMIAELRAKPGSDGIGVTVGDFATTRVSGTYTLAYLLRNTIMNWTRAPFTSGSLQHVSVWEKTA